MTAPDISIDVTRLVLRAMHGRLPTGVDRVCLSYVNRYSTGRAVLRQGGIGKMVSKAESAKLFDLLLSSPDDLPRRLCARTIRSLLTPAKQLEPDGVFFNVGHSGLDDPAYIGWLRRNRLRPVFMVHDLIPITHPEYCRAGEAQRHERRIAAMLRCGAGLITNSKATEHVLRRHADTQGLPMPPAVAAPLAGVSLPGGRDQPMLDAPYFVMLGTIEPRKNHALMLKCWRMLAEQWQSGPMPRLVLIGQRGWNVEHVDSLLNRGAAAQTFVVERSRCSDTELATWLRHARALLFPSFAEGYGLPLAEALAHGTPVIASDLPVFREIAGDIPDYVNPLDGIGWLAAIASYARDDGERRAAQLERIRRFVPSTWDQHFAIVDDLLPQLLGSDRG